MRISMLAVVLLASPAAWADEDASELHAMPCRPTIACTAEIVPAGALEVEMGFSQRRAGQAVDSVPALLKYSVTDRVQLQLGTNNIVNFGGTGAAQTFDGVYGGAKVVLVERGDVVPAVAVSALVSTSTGGMSVTTTDGDFWLYLSQDLPGVHADLNVGVNVLSMDSQPAVQYLGALSLSRDLAWGVGAMLENYAFVGGGSYADHDAGVLSGFTYAPTPRLMFDLGTDIALFRDSRNLTLFAGFTIVPYQYVKKQTAAGSSVAQR